MNTITTPRTYPFLQGGGEMGELTRQYDWSKTVIGGPELWPQSLRTTVSNLLRSKFPMFLWWGPEMIQFYNDAYRPSLGNEGKHPTALGQRGEDCWPEIWPIIYPLIEQVRQTGEATWMEDQLVPIYRNGHIEDVYWTYSYSAVLDDAGRQAGILVTCTETTDKVKNYARVRESEDQLLFAIEATELGTWDLNPITGKLSNNARMRQWFGLPAEGELELEQAISAIPPRDQDRVKAAMKKAMDPASGGFFDIEHSIINKETGEERILHAKGRVWFNEQNIAYRFNGTLQDVTGQVKARKKLETSEKRFRDLVDEAPVATAVYKGKDLVIELANEAMLKIFGKGPSIVGKKLKDAMPELLTQPFIARLEQVYATGITYEGKEDRADVVVNGKLQTFYFNYTYKALRNSEGEIDGILNMAMDVTHQVLSRHRTEERESKLRNLVVQAPIGICLVKGEPATVEMVNDLFLEIVGKERHQFEAAPYWEVLKEAASAYEPIMQNVFRTGEIYRAHEHRIPLIRKGVEEVLYISFVYAPIMDTGGVVETVMIVAMDVTHQVMSRRKLEEAIESSILSVGAADLGTFEVNLLTNEISSSARLDEIFGVEKNSARERYLRAYHSDDLAVREEAYRIAYRTGKLDYEARVINKDGSVRWIRSKGKVFFDAERQPVRLMGVSQDITAQKQFEEEMERQVKQRTMELELMNRELQRSNANLEEFAHAASHDLKEPIRKIHFFTDRLKNQLIDKLSWEEALTFTRIENASKRMSDLIDDLLLYSHVSHHPHKKEDVDLQENLQKALEDLEVEIQEKNAVIRYEDLPVVPGYRRQLQQLFQNLVSNALKYSRAGVAPEVTISYTKISANDLDASLPGIDPEQELYLIEVADNGIGFEQKEAERIFQMFQRLHGNAEYSGSGVGLSIARKVVENHNGKIVAMSEPGEGAVFRIYLPA